MTVSALQGYVFVVTYGRSGSTVLTNLLNRLPGYLIRGENHNAVMPLAQSWLRLRDGAPLPDHRRSGKPTGPDHPWYGAEFINPHSFGHALADAFARHVLQPAPDTRILGYKEIRWDKEEGTFAPTLDFLWTFFPNTKFIFNTRDFDGLYKSGWWKTMAEPEVHRIWESANTAMQAYQQRHPERCHALHYDDWKGQPDAFEPLFRFLGEPWDRDLVVEVMGQKLTHLK